MSEELLDISISDFPSTKADEYKGNVIIGNGDPQSSTQGITSREVDGGKIMYTIPVQYPANMPPDQRRTHYERLFVKPEWLSSSFDKSTISDPKELQSYGMNVPKLKKIARESVDPVTHEKNTGSLASAAGKVIGASLTVDRKDEEQLRLSVYPPKF